MSFTIWKLLRSLTSAIADVEKSAKASAIRNDFFNMTECLLVPATLAGSADAY